MTHWNLDSNVYLYEKDYYKCSNHNLTEFYTIPILQMTPSNLNLERIFHPIWYYNQSYPFS